MSAVYVVLALIGAALYTVAMVQLGLLALHIWNHLRPPKGPDALA